MFGMFNRQMFPGGAPSGQFPLNPGGPIQGQQQASPYTQQAMPPQAQQSFPPQQMPPQAQFPHMQGMDGQMRDMTGGPPTGFAGNSGVVPPGLGGLFGNFDQNLGHHPNPAMPQDPRHYQTGPAMMMPQGGPMNALFSQNKLQNWMR